MKDNLLLLVVALAASGIAWLFWHYAGDNGVMILLLMIVVSQWGVNRQLRKKLKDHKSGNRD